MNPGVLLAPYLFFLAFAAHRRRTLLLAFWAFAVLALPTFRNRFGPVSIYWCDLASLAVLFGWMRQRAELRGALGLKRWLVLILASVSVGAVSALLRYGAVLEPGYWMYRYAIGLSPLLLVPKLLGEQRNLDAVARGVSLAGVTFGVVALAQSATFVPEASDAVSTFLYGPEYRHFNLRVPGMYGSSTAFSGAAVLLVILATFLRHFGARSRWYAVSVCGGVLAALLTYSRHGLLALAVFGALLALLNPRRMTKVLGMAVLLGVLAAPVVSYDFWDERISRGGITTDANLRSRLVDRPLEFLERLEADPSFFVGGIGLGAEHALSRHTYREASKGFVSNTFILFWVHGGILPFLVITSFFLAALLRAARLAGSSRAVCVASVVGTIITLASDNYGYFHNSLWFVFTTINGFVLMIPAGAKVPVALRSPAAARTAGVHTPAPGPSSVEITQSS